MPFYIINKKPVFLTWERDNKLREQVYGLDNVISSRIVQTGEKNKDHKIFREELNRKYKESPSNFVTEWVKFDLIGEDAKYNVWDLVYDYTCYYRCGYTLDGRDEKRDANIDYSGDNYYFPQGKIFILNHYVEAGKWYWKYTGKFKGRTVKTVIDCMKVERIIGDLSRFLIVFDNYSIECGETFEVSIF
jgi:hypothetical protein